MMAAAKQQARMQHCCATTHCLPLFYIERSAWRAPFKITRTTTARTTTFYLFSLLFFILFRSCLFLNIEMEIFRSAEQVQINLERNSK